ncbi:DUF3861 domain-containing protein [Aureimonas pseudogalii]|uniref:DUF3861 domain-containing protein n=1 Tax=Aureimonas pseudogalii TaxID=1744844 RepID=A0A7W6H8S2_9HYPH|nr:DUF3861 domain-containing protein [Aureimonas pseudogalii]MBB4000715.1 hypothetical protein [Aureimonas pseudogalii]
MPHTYQLVLTHISDQRGNAVGQEVCQFEFQNHDDLATIIERTRVNNIVPVDEVSEFCIGLKLLTEVAMRHRTEPTFAEFFSHLGAFIRSIKAPKSNEAE